jgi:hypothetical protein
LFVPCTLLLEAISCLADGSGGSCGGDESRSVWVHAGSLDVNAPAPASGETKRARALSREQGQGRAADIRASVGALRAAGRVRARHGAGEVDARLRVRNRRFEPCGVADSGCGAAQAGALRRGRCGCVGEELGEIFEGARARRGKPSWVEEERASDPLRLPCHRPAAHTSPSVQELLHYKLQVLDFAGKLFAEVHNALPRILPHVFGARTGHRRRTKVINRQNRVFTPLIPLALSIDQV